MADKATAAVIKGLIDQNAIDNKAAIDANAVKLKAQVDALVFNPDPPPVVAAPKISYAVPIAFTVGKPIGVLVPVNSGGAAVYSGVLPDGLTLDPNTGQISGTPKTAIILTNFTVTAINVSGSSSAIIPMSVTAAPVVVNPPPAGDNPGGTNSDIISLNGVTGKTISGFNFDGQSKSPNLLYLKNCNNMHITKNRFLNTNGMSVFLEGCNNITVDYNYFNKVNFAVYALSCGANVKVVNNQGLNRWAPELFNANFSHWIQFNKVNGGGLQINNNIFEDIDGVAVHPHDHITVIASNGVKGDPIQINGNWLRGGQRAAWPSGGDTGGGIMPGDESGSLQICQNNILVNTGCAGIQTVGSATDIIIDGNKIFSATNPVIMQGITIRTAVPITVTNNRIFVTNKNNISALQKDQEPAIYWGNSTGPGSNVKQSGNILQDKTITEDILPKQIITYK